MDLGNAKVISAGFKEKARPMIAIKEILLIEETVKADARFQDALRRRGLFDDLDKMCIDPWTVGDFNIPIEQGRRVVFCFIWMRMFPLDNFYAHPVEGVHALIDVSTLEVLEIVDHFEASGDYIPVPRMPLNYDHEVLRAFREPSSRLDIVQPDGAGFVVQGNHVEWENWDFRVGFNGREGLGALHHGIYGKMENGALSSIARRLRKWWSLTVPQSGATIARTFSTAAN